ncbi:hypothetical protein [Actinoplanes sp. NPDC048796]
MFASGISSSLETITRPRDGTTTTPSGPFEVGRSCRNFGRRGFDTS